MSSVVQFLVDNRLHGKPFVIGNETPDLVQGFPGIPETEVRQINEWLAAIGGEEALGFSIGDIMPNENRTRPATKKKTTGTSNGNTNLSPLQTMSIERWHNQIAHAGINRNICFDSIRFERLDGKTGDDFLCCGEPIHFDYDLIGIDCGRRARCLPDLAEIEGTWGSDN